MLVVLVRQIMLANYEGAFFCILTLLLLYVPSWIQVKLRIELPAAPGDHHFLLHLCGRNSG